jgi:hypothetical protein
VLTGVSGLSAIPFDGKTERAVVVTTTVLVLAATAVVSVLADSDTDAFVRECPR